MSTHTVNLTKLEPLPDAVGLQKALEALEAAEVDLYPRDAQPTNVLRNRIQFSAFVLRSYLAKQERDTDDAKDAARYRWLQSRTCGLQDNEGRHYFGFPSLFGLRPVGNITQGRVGQHLNAAIDAAMQPMPVLVTPNV